MHETLGQIDFKFLSTRVLELEALLEENTFVLNLGGPGAFKQNYESLDSILVGLGGLKS
jgi:hypothetical protein